MEFLGLGIDGIAFTPTAAEAEQMASGATSLATDFDGVRCWVGMSGGRNEAATTYLRSVGAIDAAAHVGGWALFAAVGTDGHLAPLNEVAMEALGWSITRALVTQIEERLAKAA